MIDKKVSMVIRGWLFLGVFFLSICFIGFPVNAKKSSSSPTSRAKNPDQILIEIQRDLIELDRQFEVIRKDLFFPKNNEVLVYLRNNIKDIFPVRSIELYLNGKRIHQHEYSDSEVVAFNFSSLQPLYRFEVSPGEYRMEARLQVDSRKGGNRQHRFYFKKESLPRFVEIEIAYDRKLKVVSVSEKVK